MRAITFKQPGDPDVLVVSEVPSPRPQRGEVVIDVVAAGVNRADLLQRKGYYAVPPGGSPILGLEVSGTISQLGEGVTGWRVGDDVCALLVGGGYAEQVAVAAELLLPIPRGVSTEDAAGLPEVVCTVYSNVIMLAEMKAGEWLLVHGGGSGIGTAAIQIATAFGIHVAVTAGSAEKRRLSRSLGAEVAVDYRTEDFVAEIKSATGGRGADVVLDIIGAKYLARNIDAVAVDGRLVIIGLQGGTKTEIDLAAVTSKRITVIGSTLRGRSHEAKVQIVNGVRKDVWPLVEAGAVRPVIHARLKLADAAKGHQILEASENAGKVLLTMRD